jgi:HAD superfamily hydrolase (TIGR01509 family)
MEPPAGTAALLFDCDGTLVDTLSLYRKCWQQVYGRHGFDMADDWFYERVGLSVRPFVREAFPHASEAELDGIQHEGMSMFMESTHLLEVNEHVVEVAHRFRGVLPMVVVSSGIASAVNRTLEATAITDLFDFVVTLESVPLAKPAPDCYLYAAERLGVPTERCVAYEDSTAGIESALAAGVGTVVDIRTAR